MFRNDFPLLSRTVYGKPLIYLDNGATTQKPRQVVEALVDGYYSTNANVHRGVHYLSQQATELHEASRRTVQRFLNARSECEIIFTRGTTESINLLASSFVEGLMKPGDEVIVSTMEHHSNIVPWQLWANRKGIVLKVIPMTDEGELVQEAYEALFTERTRLVSVMHMSNVLGTINPIRRMVETAHRHGVPFLVDAAQSVPHLAIDVQALDVDFLVFSSHKVYGPTGIGVLYGKEEWLEKLPPYQGGGEMIQTVSFERTTFNELPFKFEAGTPDYIGTVGLAKALDYVTAIGMDKIAAHEHELTTYAIDRLSRIPDMRIIGQAKERGAVVSFLLGDVHPFDLGTLLDRLGIAVRTGHHCAQPLMQRLGIEGTVRASFGLYNTLEEVDALAEAIERVRHMF
ncbi:MAG: cysteine desulfurase [Bacteroides sp.]|nr:cysteine desulfurase [Bacteroides sp.]